MTHVVELAVAAPEVLSLKAAARLAGSSPTNLRTRIEAGDIRVQHVSGGSGDTFQIRRDQFEEDLEALRCGYRGCQRYALAASGRCSAHALAGKPQSPEHVAKSAASRRTHANEYRACEWCGRLNLVEGKILAKGGGRFCDNRCASLKQFETKAGREVACPKCGRARYRSLSALESMATDGYCRECFPGLPAYRAKLRVAQARNQERRMEKLEELRSNGVVDIRHIAELCELQPPAIRYYVARGELPRRSEHFGHGRRTLFDVDAFDSWFTTFASNRQKVFMSWRISPEQDVGQRVRAGEREKWLSRGLSNERAMTLLRRDAEARRRLRWAAVSQHRSPGRPRAEARARRWLDRRSALGTAVAVLYEDVLAHPEDWSGYPTTAELDALSRWQLSDFETRGRDRINQAIHRLLAADALKLSLPAG